MTNIPHDLLFLGIGIAVALFSFTIGVIVGRHL